MENDIQKRIAELMPGLMKSPRLYVHDIDWQKGTALVVEADEAFYRNAVFLDARALEGVKVGAHVQLSRLFAIMDEDNSGPKPARFIFHVGHAGSTLVSRLLDEIPGVLGLREPLVLRNFAAVRNAMKTGLVPENEAAFRDTLRRSYRLLSRTFAPKGAVVVKATSICNNLAPDLLGFHPGNRGVGLYVTLETMLANMLMKDRNADIEGFANVRFHGLKGRLGELSFDPGELNRAQLIAAAWIAEVVEFYRLTEGPMGDRVRFVDFDAFLADPKKGVTTVLKALNLPHKEKMVEKLTLSKVFSSYAKQPDFEYAAGDRQAHLESSKQTNRAAIAEGLEFAKDLGKKHRIVQQAIDKFPLS